LPARARVVSFDAREEFVAAIVHPAPVNDDEKDDVIEDEWRTIP
jgi:hypothetical protein